MLETYFGKSISVNGSNNAGIWGWSLLQPPEANGGSGALRQFYSLFSKKYALLGIFCPKFLLKNSFFKCLNKVYWCASKHGRRQWGV